jgi:putative chitinase
MDTRQIQSRLCAKGYDLIVDGVIGPKTYAALLSFVGMQRLCAMHDDLGRAANAHFAAHKIDTPLRLTHFLAQSCVETRGFTVLVENLNYSAKRLTEVWPARFPNIAAAAPFAHNPEALANKTYGGRFGNNAAGDGWKYRGRGTKQTTFKDNYAEVEKVTGLPVVDQPDMLAEPDTGMRAGCIYWSERDCAALADADNIFAITRRVNGGTNGLQLRIAARNRGAQILL